MLQQTLIIGCSWIGAVLFESMQWRQSDCMSIMAGKWQLVAPFPYSTGGQKEPWLQSRFIPLTFCLSVQSQKQNMDINRQAKFAATPSLALFVNLKNVVCKIGEDAEVLMSLYDPVESKFIRQATSALKTSSVAFLTAVIKIPDKKHLHQGGFYFEDEVQHGEVLLVGAALS